MNERENFLTIEALSSVIDQKVQRIQKGELKIQMLDALLGEVYELQERLIILKFKSMESLAKPTVEKKQSIADKKVSNPIEGNTLQLDFGLEKKSDVSENQISLIDSIAEISVEKKSEPVKSEPVKKEVEIEPKKLFSEEPKQTLGEKMKSKAIADIHKEIKLNARLGMIKQLFSNKDTDFKEAIDHLNNSANLMEAQNHLEELKNKREWDEENKWYLVLSELIERRFL